jgi:hypothetical protein
VAQLIKGFETPFGMDLRATVHWVATWEHAAQDPDAAYLAVQAWNTRKVNMMHREHVRSAWMRLRQLGWADQRTSPE